MIDQLPGLVLLVVLAALVAFAVGKLPTADLKEVLLGSNVIVVSAALFGLLLVVQLLKEQSWMPDLLKVVAGVVAGAIAAKKEDKKPPAGDSVSQTAIGEQIQQAARDINNIKSDLNKIENSLVTQIEGPARDGKSILAYQETEQIEINYRDNEQVYQEYKRISEDNPDFFKYKPILGSDVRAWYDRQLSFFGFIPNAMDKLTQKVREIEAADWKVKEVRFDFSSVKVVVSLDTEKRIPLPHGDA
jgi:hypothetical protein